MAQKQKLLLVTNDDGVFAPGINELISIASEFGKVLVVAPESGRSGMSHAVTINTPLRLKLIRQEDNITVYSSNGTPVDCVKLAMHNLVTEKPDIILSGINHGANSSVNIFYSGTMAAAIEGCMLQIPSAGISICEENHNADLFIFRKDIENIISGILEKGLPDRTCLNVNFPYNYHQGKGIRVCRQAHAYWEEEFEKRMDSHNIPYFWLKGKFVPLEFHEDTDIWALHKGYCSVVPVQVDITAHHAIKELKPIFETC